jgi:hypothetical protein
MPLYLDFSLGFVIAQTRITQPFAHHRLNVFENTVTALARQWHPRLPLVPDREIRMSDETREALLGWIEVEEPGRGHTLQRLAVYAASVTDESVPEGWVRLRITPRQHTPTY